MCRYSMGLAVCAGDPGCCGSVWLYTRNRATCDNHKSDESTCTDAVVSMRKFEVRLTDLPEMRCFSCTEKIALPRLSLSDRICDSLALSVVEVSDAENSVKEEDDDSYMILPQDETKDQIKDALTDEESVYSDELEDITLPEITTETSSFVEPAIHDEDDDRWFVSAGYSTSEQPTPIDNTFWGVNTDYTQVQQDYPDIGSPGCEEPFDLDLNFQPSISVTSCYENPVETYVYSPNTLNEENCYGVDYEARVWPPIEKKQTHTRVRKTLSTNFTTRHEQAHKEEPPLQKAPKSGRPKLLAASKTTAAPAQFDIDEEEEHEVYW